MSIAATALLVVAACAQQLGPPPHHSRGADIRLVSDIETIQATVPAHATLDSLLRGNQLPDNLVSAAVGAARSVFNPRLLRADRPYRLVRSLDGLLREFTYQIDADRVLRIISRDRNDPEALDASVMPYEKTVEVSGIDARIDSDHASLISAIDESGERVQLAMELADIFSGQVDFQTELQPGDSFKVLFEKTSHDGEFSGYGAVLGASISVDGRSMSAFRWQDPATGHVGYYDQEGRSLKRFLLKSPLKFEPRITSRFTTRRFHPIDHVYKAHLGVDYGAPTGSPVVAVAAGVVLSAAYSGAGGNMVHLKHAGGVETYYLHLSAFGSGIRAGAHVEQGQVIGRVGATGAATGPHLDYRLKRNGVFVNPVAEHARQAPGDPIAGAQLAAFKTGRDSVLKQMTAALAITDTQAAVASRQ
ncbi:MAG TPA: M23 family metallopeptidase [Vicinamibacterales bacterium]|nr:M23 family metallopeptidase [Vicinamibacterales bacterium]